MDEKIKNLWNNHKILFFILIPLIILWFARNIIISLLVSSGNKAVSEATEKSNALKQESDVANAKADQIIADANSVGKKPIDEDWNK